MQGAMNGQQNHIRFFKAGEIYDQEKGEITPNLVKIFLENDFAEEVADEQEKDSKVKVPGSGERKGLGVPENKGLSGSESKGSYSKK
jgi:hypothetical protein